MLRRLIGLAAVLALVPCSCVFGQDFAQEVPSQAPKDAVMADPAEVTHVTRWVEQAFAGVEASDAAPRLRLEVRRQDHNVLRLGQSCMETPIRIGSRAFEHGLGTHANSEIVVTLPPKAKTFKAMVGIDNNYDTKGTNGSVEFSVEIAGKEVFRTPTVRGGNEPAAVEVAIPDGTKQLVLKVDATADGPPHDQSDWADAQVILQDGSVVWLDDDRSDLLFLKADPPFSFVYGGKSSAELLPTWSHACEKTEKDGRTQYRASWTDPKTSLRVSAEVTMFQDYPAADWVLSFENQGKADTPILENVQALDVQLGTGLAARPAVVHRLTGDVCGEQSFVPIDENLEPGKEIRFAPAGGRSSNGAFPFFNVQYADLGLITAIGWTGQWATSLKRAPTGPTQLQAGMELTHLVLHAGERIRSPRILVLAWKGDREAAHNRFRRLMLFHYVPQVDGRAVRLPLFLQCFDRYSWSVPTWATEAGQIEAVGWAKRLGFETHWLDAAWFPGGFPNGVGNNWRTKPQEFPNGLKPVSDACHKQGLKFILWFEPERVAAGTEIANEHPEFVFGGEKGGLFKLNDPAAQRWLTDLLLQRISAFGLDWYRNDFNIDPLGFWRSNDTPDRQGMTEIRYVEGLYAMWDEFRAKNPGLMIDNCASGGRRIDLEMCMRSVPLWRSDTSCSPGHADWNQSQTCGLSRYLPLHTACGWTPEPYDFRSSATGGAIAQWDYMNKDFPVELGQQTTAEAKQNRKYWYGDFYQLTSCGLKPDEFVAYQFHRADLNAGLVLAFRRSECAYRGLVLGLKGLNPDATYTVEFVDDARETTTKTMSGSELAGDLVLRIPKQPGSLVVRYREATAGK
jgi:alpha-galactosidase